MSDTKVILKKKVAKRKPGNTKIYPVREILEKYNLTPQEFQEIAQANLKPKHITSTGITLVGLMMVGKAVKKLNKAEEKKAEEKAEEIVEAEKESPNIRKLEVGPFKPPNHLRLYCIDYITVNGVQERKKVTVIVTRKIHDGAKSGTSLLCERIEEGLFRHPPLERA